MLVTKIGLDGHDRGSRVVAAFLRDAGMEVLYTPPWQEIAQVIRLAEEEDVDVIGISSLATDHLLVPKLMKALKKARLEHVPVVVGGIVPDEDEKKLRQGRRAARLPSRRVARGDRLQGAEAGRRGAGGQGPGSAGVRREGAAHARGRGSRANGTVAFLLVAVVAALLLAAGHASPALFAGGCALRQSSPDGAPCAGRTGASTDRPKQAR